MYFFENLEGKVITILIFCQEFLVVMGIIMVRWMRIKVVLR